MSKEKCTCKDCIYYFEGTCLLGFETDDETDEPCDMCTKSIEEANE